MTYPQSPPSNVMQRITTHINPPDWTQGVEWRQPEAVRPWVAWPVMWTGACVQPLCPALAECHLHIALCTVKTLYIKLRFIKFRLYVCSLWITVTQTKLFVSVSYPIVEYNEHLLVMRWTSETRNAVSTLRQHARYSAWLTLSTRPGAWGLLSLSMYITNLHNQPTST